MSQRWALDLSSNVGSPLQALVPCSCLKVCSQGWVHRLSPRVGFRGWVRLGIVGRRRQNQLVTQVGCVRLVKVVCGKLMLIELGKLGTRLEIFQSISV